MDYQQKEKKMIKQFILLTIMSVLVILGITYLISYFTTFLFEDVMMVIGGLISLLGVTNLMNRSGSSLGLLTKRRGWSPPNTEKIELQNQNINVWDIHEYTETEKEIEFPISIFILTVGMIFFITSLILSL